MDRKQHFGGRAGAGLRAQGGGAAARSRQRGPVLNDVHSALHPTRVARVRAVTSLASLRAAVLEARRRKESISIAGGRHAMGGQQFGAGTLHVDTRPMQRILSLDRERGLVEVEAGIQWPALIEGLLAAQAGSERPWSIVQKQTGADHLSIGGAVAANVHGRGLALAPIAEQVESLVLVDARGQIVRCSRAENRESFALAIGGYGLCGAVHSVRLRLAPRAKLERAVEMRSSEGLAEAFEQRIREGFTFGDFQFETDERSPTFLRRGVFACYRPVAPEVPIAPSQKELGPADWRELLLLAHVDKARAFEIYSRHYLATHGQIYWTDTHQRSSYPDHYHAEVDRLPGAKPGSEMISELFVPRAALSSFLGAAADALVALRANVIYGTVRLIERDDLSLLAWARERWACVVLNLHVEHDPAGIARAKRAFRALIDLALERRGSYYLTYHRWAAREQVLAAHPRLLEFLRKKLELDPEQRFQSEWWRHHRAMFADRL